MTASTSWTVSPGAFEGSFSGGLSFTATTPYVMTVTCSSSLGSPCLANCAYPACPNSAILFSIASLGGGAVAPEADSAAGTLQFVLSPGQYSLGWQLVGGTGPGCCLGTQGPTGSASSSTSMNVSFAPSQ
jgi:hypothetical protein